MSIKEDIKNEQQAAKKTMPPTTDAEIELRSLADNVIDRFRRYVFPDAYRIIKNKLLFSGDIRMANIKMWRANNTAAVYPLTESTADTFSANLYDSVSVPKVAARQPEDVGLWEQAQDFCDRAYDVADANWAKQMARNEAVLIGTSYWMAWREKREEIGKYTTNWKDDLSVSMKINRPMAQHVSFFEMFYDLSTTDFYRARWKIRRKILSLREVEKRYSNLIKFTDTVTQKIKDSVWNEVSKLDFTKIYDIKNYESCYSKERYAERAKAWELAFFEDNVLLSITDKNPFVEVIEYWNGDDLAIMINWYIYYDGASPYPFWDPFWIIVFEKLPWTCMWRWIGHKVSTLQQQATSLYCKIRDAVNQHIAPMYSVVKWMLSKDQSWQTAQTITYTPWKVIQVESPDIKNWWINPIDFVDFNMVQIARDELNATIARAQEIIWTNSYVQWGQGKVERSWMAASLKVWVTKTRLKPIEASIQRFDQHMFEQWLWLASLSENKDLVVRVLWEDWAYKYSTITPSDLMNKFDITVDIDWLIEQTRVQRTQEAIQLLQAIGQININPISQTPVIKPESIVQYIAEQSWNSVLKAMTPEERVSYAKEHIDIAAQIKWAEQPPQPTPPEIPPQPQDLWSLPWFFDSQGTSSV